MIKRNWRTLCVALTFLFDVTAILLAAYFVHYFNALYHWQMRPADGCLSRSIITFFVSFLFFSAVLGLYRSAFHLGIRRQGLILTNVIIATFLTSIVFMTVFEKIPLGVHFVAVFLLLIVFFFTVTRSLLHRLNMSFQRKGYGIYNTLIVGVSNDAVRIKKRLQCSPELGYNIVGYVRNSHLEEPELPISKPVFDLTQLSEVIDEEKISRIFYMSQDHLSDTSYLRDICQTKNVTLNLLSASSDSLLTSAHVRDIAGIPIVAPPRTRFVYLKSVIKRIVDVIGSLVAILLFAPIFIVTSLLIIMESGLPVFFTQERSAIKGGKRFRFIKFKSMVNNADEQRQELDDQNETDGVLFKIKNDPRITRVGKFIRRTSIYELPQLFNVLKGDMSLVGPRPLPIEDLGKSTDEFWETVKARDAVKTGMTGLWQVSGRSDIKFEDMILLDLYYVQNQTIMFDLEILFDTVPVVLFGRGAY